MGGRRKKEVKTILEGEIMKYFDKLCYFIILWMAYLYFHSWTWFLFFLVFVIVIFLYQEIQRKKGKEKEEKNTQARKFFLTFLTAYASSHSFIPLICSIYGKSIRSLTICFLIQADYVKR